MDFCRRFGFLFAFSALVAVALLACSDDETVEYPFERTVLDITAVKRCADGSSVPGVPCYQLRFRHPIEREGIVRYHFWLDTAYIMADAQTIDKSALAHSITLPYRGAQGDFDSLDVTQALKDGGYMDWDSLAVSVWAEYSKGSEGAVQHLYLYFGDDVPPSLVAVTDSTDAHNVWVDWSRPQDQVDFYFPDSLSGPIAGYNVAFKSLGSENVQSVGVSLKLNGQATDSWQKNQNWVRKDRKAVLQSAPSSNASTLNLAIIDGKGFSATPAENQYRLQVSGLTPNSRYSITVFAFDSAGNRTDGATAQNFQTTDTIAPLVASQFHLALDSSDGLPALDSNRLYLFWPRSVDPLRPNTGKDTIRLDSTLYSPPTCSPNACYQEVAT
jgi:hypothetical protein